MSDEDYYSGYTQSVAENGNIGDLSDHQQSLRLIAAIRRQQISTDEKIDALYHKIDLDKHFSDTRDRRAARFMWILVVGALFLGWALHYL